MIGVINENSIGFSKRGRCCCCGGVHTKEIIIMGEQDKCIKMCDECYKDLKEKMKAFN